MNEKNYEKNTIIIIPHKYEQNMKSKKTFCNVCNEYRIRKQRFIQYLEAGRRDAG